jgi:mono/diheme cytochrome c family protein
MYALVAMLAAALLLAPFAASVSARPASDQESERQAWQFVVEQGDPAAGRQAFQDLWCTTCHRVAGETAFPAPVSANPGPTLGIEQARRKPGEIAASIIAPSHEIGDQVAAKLEGRLSPMGDYAPAMTVRQLFDLVAYVRSLKAGSK